MKLKFTFVAGIALTLLSMKSFAQDKNFYIFLAFGQSNMEGNARPQPQDSTVDSRFQVLQAVDCDAFNRKKDNWYTAKPPLSRCRTGLTPGDYFGRTLVANLPKNVRVGIVNVSVAGAKIEAFDEKTYEAYVSTSADWLKNIVKEYSGNPYARLVELGKLAQKSGVIKGILLHQGESNTNDTLWTKKVKVVYDNLMKDLKLNPKSVPLLAGEVVHANYNGRSASMNKIIATLPQTIPTAHVISSADAPDGGDRLHFSAEGYRILGRHYGEKMLDLLGVKVKDKK
jgi:type 1 fimbria pilin